jgi:hypothetical protein
MQDQMMRRRFFAGTDLVEPGLVRVEEWRAEPAADNADRSPLWCAVGHKRWSTHGSAERRRDSYR